MIEEKLNAKEKYFQFEEKIRRMVKISHKY